MTRDESNAPSDRDFDLLMSAHGLNVPPDRRAGALYVYHELQRMTARLRQPRHFDSEPALIFDLTAILRTAVAP